MLGSAVKVIVVGAGRISEVMPPQRGLSTSTKYSEDTLPSSSRGVLGLPFKSRISGNMRELKPVIAATRKDTAGRRKHACPPPLQQQLSTAPPTQDMRHFMQCGHKVTPIALLGIIRRDLLGRAEMENGKCEIAVAIAAAAATGADALLADKN